MNIKDYLKQNVSGEVSSPILWDACNVDLRTTNEERERNEIYTKETKKS